MKNIFTELCIYLSAYISVIYLFILEAGSYSVGHSGLELTMLPKQSTLVFQVLKIKHETSDFLEGKKKKTDKKIPQTK